MPSLAPPPLTLTPGERDAAMAGIQERAQHNRQQSLGLGDGPR